jgi:hypothetical protein
VDERDPRVAELLGAALAGELGEEEARELEAACERDPGLRAELAELGAAAEQLRGSGVRWTDATPPPDLGARVQQVTRQDDAAAGPRRALSDEDTAQTTGAPEPVGARDATVVPLRPRRRAPLLVAAATGLVAGVGATLLGTQLADAPPSGPPGTLGAVEEVEFAGERPGSVVDGAVVAHTWGTETVLEVDGTTVGQTFQVVVVGRDGEEFSSGAFVGSEQTVTCRMNAAVLREDAAEIRIEGADETLLAAAPLPPV